MATIPVLIVSGFLGSGKTTLLNRMLKLPGLAGTAVVINEFGETALDHHLVSAGDDQVIELANGCLCCTVRGKLVETLETLLARDPHPTAIIVETTGLADPGPVMQAIMAAPALTGGLSLSGLVTLFDSWDGAAMVERHKEAQRQLALADLVVLSRLDLFGEADREPVLQRSSETIARLASAVPIMGSDAFLGWLGTLEAARLGQALAEFTPERKEAVALLGNQPHAHHHGSHDGSIACFTLSHDKPMRPGDLDMFLDLLASAHGDHVPRLKGLVAIAGENRPLLVQIAGRRKSPPEYLPAWPGDEQKTRLTVFTEGLDPRFVRDLFDGFCSRPAIDVADRQAITGNPLAIAGLSIGANRR